MTGGKVVSCPDPASFNGGIGSGHFWPKARFHDYVTIRFRNVWNLITARAYIIYIHACIVHALVRMYYVRVYITVRPPAWPAFFATSHSLDIDAFYIQSHLITKNRVDFFATFVNRLRD